MPKKYHTNKAGGLAPLLQKRLSSIIMICAGMTGDFCTWRVYYRNSHLEQFMNYQAKLKVPFGVLGIRCSDDALTVIDFLPATAKPQRAANKLAETVCEQLLRYLKNPDVQFYVPLELNGTTHQKKVWQAMLDIPRGQTRSYGELAAELKSCAQAVGQACGANPIPVIVPCHRVVGKAGLGGFAHHTCGAHLDIKRWLLAHEGATKPESVIDRATSHSTKPASGQVAGYPAKAGIQSNKSAGFRVKPGMTKPK